MTLIYRREVVGKFVFYFIANILKCFRDIASRRLVIMFTEHTSNLSTVSENDELALLVENSVISFLAH